MSVFVTRDVVVSGLTTGDVAVERQANRRREKQLPCGSFMASLHRAGLLTVVRKGAGRLPYIWSLNSLIDLAEKRFVSSEGD